MIDVQQLRLYKTGKVRDIYEMDNDKLVLSHSDRISAFDIVLTDEKTGKNAIPDKGSVLARLSRYFFEKAENAGIKTHFLEMPKGQENIIVVKTTDVFPVEFIMRHYLYGSYYNAFRNGQMELPPGSERVLAGKLSEPVFTPTTKAEKGEHDVLLPYFRSMEEGKEILYRIGDMLTESCDKAGMILCDFKIELGYDKDGSLIVIDELGTPDACRFWPRESYRTGQRVPSKDKQIVRDYLVDIGYKKAVDDAKSKGLQPPSPPELPSWLVEKVRETYIEIFESLTGERF